VNLEVVASLTGLLVALVAVMMLAPLGLAIYDAQIDSALAYGIAAASTAFVAIVLR
jgi:hypothetical protein